MVARRTADRLAAVRRKPRQGVQYGPFRREAVSGKLHVQVPEGRRGKLDRRTLLPRSGNRRNRPDRYRRRNRPIHSAPAVDAVRRAGFLPAEQAAKSLRSVIERPQRRDARRLRRTRRTLRRTRRPVDRHVPARRRPFRRPQRTERLHAPVLAQHPQRLSETTDRRTVGSHGDAGRLRRPGLLLVHRNLAAQTRPVCGTTGRQG